MISNWAAIEPPDRKKGLDLDRVPVKPPAVVNNFSEKSWGIAPPMSLSLVYDDHMKTSSGPTDQWWTSLSCGEKEFIRALIRMVQSAKHSEVIEVARAARKWESGLTFFFKVRPKNQRTSRWSASFNSLRKSEPNRDNSRQTISCQSNAHS